MSKSPTYMKGQDPLPNIPQDLMKALEERFPERCPNPKNTEREIWIEVGKRELVRFLKSQFDSQNKNVLLK